MYVNIVYISLTLEVQSGNLEFIRTELFTYSLPRRQAGTEYWNSQQKRKIGLNIRFSNAPGGGAFRQYGASNFYLLSKKKYGKILLSYEFGRLAQWLEYLVYTCPPEPWTISSVG